MTSPAETTMRAAIAGGCNQRRAAEIYAEALHGGGTNWKAVHLAILARWGLAGLKKIKGEAWKMVRGNANPA